MITATLPDENAEDLEDERVYALGCRLELAQTIVGRAFNRIQTRIYEEQKKSPNEKYLQKLRDEGQKLWNLKSNFRIERMQEIEDAIKTYPSYIVPQP